VIGNLLGWQFAELRNELRNRESAMAHTIPSADYLDKSDINSARYKQTIKRVCLGTQGLKKLPQVGFENIVLPLVGLGLDRIHTPNGCIVRVLSDINRLHHTTNNKATNKVQYALLLVLFGQNVND
jgi:hypothetical protein